MQLLIVLLALSLALRALGMLASRPLGIDEGRLALNVGGRPYLHLLTPLDYDQSAPILFLWLVKASTDLFGLSEASLRLIPLIAGTLCVVATYLGARLVLRLPYAVLATGIAALSPLLLFYSLFLKQYTMEALIAAGILLLAFETLRRPEDAKVAGGLVIGGALAVWASASVVLVMAGVVVALAIERRQSPDRHLKLLTMASVVWSLSFLVAYGSLYQNAVSNPYMMRHWAPVLFHPATEGWLGRMVEALVVALWSLAVGYPRVSDSAWFHWLRASVAVMTLMLVLLGTLRILRTKGPASAALLAVPLLVTLGAAMAGKYPFFVRLLLFAAPMVFILMAAGVEGVSHSRLLRRAPGSSAMLFVLLLGPPAYLSLAQVLSPGSYENLRELTALLRAARPQGEPIYVSSGSIPAWGVYSTDWGAPDQRRLEFLSRIASSGGGAFENAPSRGGVVHDEGRDLVYHSPNGLELYGVYTGIEWLPLRGLLQSEPDPGWAANEAGRIRAVARPRVWLLVAQTRGQEHGEMILALERSGIECQYLRKESDSFVASCSASTTLPVEVNVDGRKPD